MTRPLLKPPPAHAALTRCDHPNCCWTYVGDPTLGIRARLRHRALMHAGKRP